MTEPTEKREGLAAEFRRLAEFCRMPGTTFRTLVDELATRGHAFLSLVLSLLFFVPVVIPGLSVVAGAVILIAGLRMASGRPVWLPRRLLLRPVRGETMARLFERAERLARKMERIIRPRGRFMARNPTLHRFNGIVIALGGFLLLLPLPPGTNPPPAFGVALVSIGVLEQDGLFVASGYAVLALLALLFTLAAVVGIDHLHEWLAPYV
jgi:hypothetical protein